MRLEAYSKSGEVISKDIERVVVYDDHNNPLAICIRQAPNFYYVSRINDKDFKEALVSLGINRTVVVEMLDTEHLNSNPPAKIII